ncbi:MAG: hypothetical protein JW731_16050 [Bacteroidales bacterium]|nr:hypothetical protein [Bacteroidales bacterium]
MDNRFLCPHCRSDLKVGDHIVFAATNRFGRKGVLMLSPELGNYTILHDEHFKYKPGEHLDFYCPVCHGNLAIPHVSKELAEVLMVDDEGVEYRIIFSEIAGKKVTIQVKDDQMVKVFGEDADSYTNFWGIGPRY